MRKGLFADKVAIVTGGAKGIGHGIVLEFLREGANVVVADIDKKSLQTMSTALSPDLKARTVLLTADITSDSSQKEIVEGTIKKFGRIDILVNNAAVVYFKDKIPLNPPEEETQKVFETNYHAHRKLSRTIANLMRDRKIEGSIIFITSVHAKLVRMQEHYHASKAALEATMQEMAVEYGPFGIRVNSIAPGAIDTNPNATDSDLKKGHFRQEILLGRLGRPEEVGKTAVFLASNDWSKYITGTTITVDGGLSHFNWVTRQYLENIS